MLTAPVCPSPEYPALEQAAGLAFGLLKMTVEICQKAGVIGPGDPYHKSMHCWAMVNGFTTLYSEGRLEWLGVRDENAKAALRIFVDQFLSGEVTGLEPSTDFKLFSTNESTHSIAKLKNAEAAILEILKNKE